VIDFFLLSILGNYGQSSDLKKKNGSPSGIASFHHVFLIRCLRMWGWAGFCSANGGTVPAAARWSR
jgi:hypothetical protein